MKLLVGLGNPGPQYETTRHNAGFLLLDLIADHAGVTFSTHRKFEAEIAKGSLFDQETLFLKPLTFMNLSGRSVLRILTYYRIAPEDVVVLHDDIDLEFGRVRLRSGGGHGGHNGVRSLLQEAGCGPSQRLKLGVGRPEAADKTAVHQWVLAPFRDEELLVLQQDMLEAALLRLREIYRAV
ncbi:MAG: aminoacyl-tRNA hydrolase [Deltaproteobacteria bacterium]|nr:aminoacyl-tRNA hydrolase [Deltaproteobacteria bacterium]